MKSANSSNINEGYFPQDKLETPISQIYNMKISQRTAIETNFTLQIIGIKKLEKKPAMQDSNRNNNMFCLNLSDNIFSYNGFIVVDRTAMDLNILDLIKVYSLNILPTEKQQKLFVIKNYEIVGKGDGVLGNPQNIAKLVATEDFDNQEDQGNFLFKLWLNFNVLSEFDLYLLILGNMYGNSSRPSHHSQQIFESNNLPSSNYLNNNPNFNRSGYKVDQNDNDHGI